MRFSRWISTFLVFFSPLSDASADLVCQGRFRAEELVVRISPASQAVAINGVPLRPVGRCHRERRPSTRHLRCAFQNANQRVELYFWARTTSGRVMRDNAIVWRGAEPTRIALKCEKN